jgi:hypothetical protein
MSMSVGVIALVCALLFFKAMGFLLRLVVIVLVLGAGYWTLAPYFDWQPLPLYVH